MIHKIVWIVFRWASHFKWTTFLQGTEYCTTYNIVKHSLLTCMYGGWQTLALCQWPPGLLLLWIIFIEDTRSISPLSSDHSPRMETGCWPDGGGGGNHNLKGQYFPVTRMMDGHGSRDTVPSQLPMPIILYNTQPSSWCPFQWEWPSSIWYNVFPVHNSQLRWMMNIQKTCHYHGGNSIDLHDRWCCSA